jgi:hypothetical protein
MAVRPAGVIIGDRSTRSPRATPTVPLMRPDVVNALVTPGRPQAVDYPAGNSQPRFATKNDRIQRPRPPPRPTALRQDDRTILTQCKPDRQSTQPQANAPAQTGARRSLRQTAPGPSQPTTHRPHSGPRPKPDPRRNPSPLEFEPTPRPHPDPKRPHARFGLSRHLSRLDKPKRASRHSRTGPAPDPHRTRTGPAPDPHRTRTGPAPDPHRTRTGPAPDPHRTRNRTHGWTHKPDPQVTPTRHPEAQPKPSHPHHYSKCHTPPRQGNPS